MVRLDLPDRPRSLIQSRGRARVKQSRLVMFVSSQGDVDTLKEFERCGRCTALVVSIVNELLHLSVWMCQVVVWF